MNKRCHLVSIRELGEMFTLSVFSLLFVLDYKIFVWILGSHLVNLFLKFSAGGLIVF